MNKPQALNNLLERIEQALQIGDGSVRVYLTEDELPMVVELIHYYAELEEELASETRWAKHYHDKLYGRGD